MNPVNQLIVSVMPVFPKSFIWLFSKRYIAGKEQVDGLTKAEELNNIGCHVTMDILGEDITKKEEAVVSKEEICRLLYAIHESGLDASVSIKLTQLGLKIDTEFCHENVQGILQVAKETKNFIRIDMEDVTTTDDTLDIYRKIRKKYKNAGTVIQAYLKRSEEDVANLINEKISNLRICKGIYKESPTVAFKDRQAIRENFIKLIQMQLESQSYVGIATHDTWVAEESKKLIQTMSIDVSNYEFQMLLGVTEKLRSRLIDEEHPMRVYVPFGEQWHGYCMRRMKENPQLAGHVVKNIFIRG